MQFGLAKAGAPAPFDRKWPNNNARIEKFDKWPCKTPFQQHRCVVPLSEFREPCYWGETAGGSTCVPTVSALLDKDGKLGRLRRPPVQQGRTAMAAGMDVNSWNLSVFAEASELAPHGT